MNNVLTLLTHPEIYQSNHDGVKCIFDRNHNKLPEMRRQIASMVTDRYALELMS